MRRSWIISAFLLSASSIACTALLGDFTTGGADDAGAGLPGEAGGPSGGCTDAQKTCNGACVSKTDPNVGCATALCTPCAATTNAAASCSKTGACSFTCNAGFNDCDGNPATGCEAKTSNDVANCGKCGDPCGTANTTNPATCASSKCVFTCKTGFGHCGTTNATGCETNIDGDPLNCGACSHSCLGGTCTKGKCDPFLLASASVPSGLAVDKVNVYFSAPSVPYIQRVQRDGKCLPAAPCPQTFLGAADGITPQTRGATALVSDGTTVFFTADAASQLVSRPVAPLGAPLTTLTKVAASTAPGYLAMGGGKLWFTSGFGATDPAPHLRSINLDGTGLTTIAYYQSPVSTFYGKGGVAVDAANVYWSSEKGNVYHAAFTDPACNEGTVTPPSCKAYGSASGGGGVAVDATFVYWTEPSSGAVKRAPKAGGQSSFIASGQDSPVAIAVLDNFVYWGNSAATGPTAGTIRRAPQMAATCDAAACEHVADAAAPDAIIAADDGIYWTNNTNTSAAGVYRLAK